MYINEIFSGLNPAQKPKFTLFNDSYGYNEMLVAKGITFFSCCEHHLIPFFGKAYIGYFLNRNIIGLSKLNRLVQYLSSRPELQGRLTIEIGQEIKSVLDIQDVAVLLEATHLCIASRGVKDISSTVITSYFSGKFEDREVKKEFLRQVDSK